MSIPLKHANWAFHFFDRTYGIVYKAQNKVTGTCVAIKKFKDSDDDEYVSIYL